MPVDIMAIFELKWAEDTIDRNAELRREILSFAEITFDSRRCSQMFVNFPKHNLVKLRRLLRPFNSGRCLSAEKGPIVEAARLEPLLTAILKPLFEEEAIFYEQLSDILKGCLMGQSLSDTQKHLFSTELPFNNSSGNGSSEEAKDNVNEMLGTVSSNYEQLSSAFSATSTSMLSADDEFEESKSVISDFNTKIMATMTTASKPSSVSSPRLSGIVDDRCHQQHA